jgi:acyl carrier protein
MEKERLTALLLTIIRETLTAKRLAVPVLGLTTPIDRTLGLDSLDWAVVVVRLEEETGVDPFRKGVSRELRTVADQVEVYGSELHVSK